MDSSLACIDYEIMSDRYGMVDKDIFGACTKIRMD